MDYIDLLFHEIGKAETREKLLYLEDDIDIANTLGQLGSKENRRVLKIALQTRYYYILFNELLEELEQMNNFINPDESLTLRFKDEVREIEKRHLKLLDI